MICWCILCILGLILPAGSILWWGYIAVHETPTHIIYLWSKVPIHSLYKDCCCYSCCCCCSVSTYSFLELLLCSNQMNRSNLYVGNSRRIVNALFQSIKPIFNQRPSQFIDKIQILINDSLSCIKLLLPDTRSDSHAEILVCNNLTHNLI